ncbi:ABC transporter ATP-binding protein [Paenibacillus sp. UNC499MF]|uniref:ABC transporter ATP-binding protein n=1 Tax=Paenibacillus sp. UNC499MF TaxID=1502751 RepID=UPI0008A02221|nr:ABC transporter ATP-binding protein [Paenibacillus sp. UNC499MF]SEG51524.1 ABC-2 type transport system ATP-binding protein [Paenibacillus sp. UNC499MF]
MSREAARCEDFAIRLSGVEKTLGDMRLGPLELVVETGTVVALVGQNGSGKSTLFRMLMNLTKADSGKVELLGSAYGEDEAETDIKRRVGYVPEESSWEQLGCTTIGELHDFLCRWYPTWNEALYLGMLEEFELTGKLKLKTLSKGMKRKLSYILAAAYEPELLLLDEATSGLDPFAAKRMIEHLVKFMDREGRSIFFSTHVMEEVRRLADYIVYINRGRLIGVYEKDQLLDDWKRIWVREAPQPASGPLPGIVSVGVGEHGGLIPIVTRSSSETEAALASQGNVPVRTTAMELEDILELLAREQI